MSECNCHNLPRSLNISTASTVYSAPGVMATCKFTRPILSIYSKKGHSVDSQYYTVYVICLSLLAFLSSFCVYYLSACSIFMLIFCLLCELCYWNREGLYLQSRLLECLEKWFWIVLDECKNCWTAELRESFGIVLKSL